MEILQRQRLEYEALLALRLREQEDVLSRQANAALQQKEDSIQAVIQANAEAQEAEHKTDLESMEKRLYSELDAKYETEYSDKLAEEKAKFVQELQDKTDTIEQLADKLKSLEMALEGFKSFEIGSIHAHKLSAAALAFSEKLETDKPAGNELELLKVRLYWSGGGCFLRFHNGLLTFHPTTIVCFRMLLEIIKLSCRQSRQFPRRWTKGFPPCQSFRLDLKRFTKRVARLHWFLPVALDWVANSWEWPLRQSNMHPSQTILLRKMERMKTSTCWRVLVNLCNRESWNEPLSS